MSKRVVLLIVPFLLSVLIAGCTGAVKLVPLDGNNQTTIQPGNVVSAGKYTITFATVGEISPGVKGATFAVSSGSSVATKSIAEGQHDVLFDGDLEITVKSISENSVTIGVRSGLLAASGIPSNSNTPASGAGNEQPAAQGSGQSGPEAPQAQPCENTYTPVCGTNNQTYSNECRASEAGAVIAYNGECRNAEPQEQPKPANQQPAPAAHNATLVGNGNGTYQFQASDYATCGDYTFTVENMSYALQKITYTVSSTAGGSQKGEAVGDPTYPVSRFYFRNNMSMTYTGISINQAGESQATVDMACGLLPPPPPPDNVLSGGNVTLSIGGLVTVSYGNKTAFYLDSIDPVGNNNYSLNFYIGGSPYSNPAPNPEPFRATFGPFGMALPGYPFSPVTKSFSNGALNITVTDLPSSTTVNVTYSWYH